MLGRIKHKLNSTKSKLDINQDAFFNVNLSGEMKELPPGDINHVVNEYGHRRKWSTTKIWV